MSAFPIIKIEDADAAMNVDDEKKTLNDDEAGADSGWAPALHFCPHVNNTSVKTFPASDIQSRNLLNCKCVACDNTRENWVCLMCYSVFCGRFAQKHMLQHYQITKHCVALGTGDLSFWCYECDSYLHHLEMPDIKLTYEQFHIAKFGHTPADAIEQKQDPSNLGRFHSSPFFSTSVSSSSSSPAISSASWMVSSLPEAILQNPVVDKVLGCIYGNALGDAFGLSTEFQTKDAILKAYGSDPSVCIPFPNFLRTAHNVRWAVGDW